MSSPSTESAAFRSALDVVRSVEPGVADAIAAELASQRASLKLIASENYASPAVLLAMGNWLSDKYAEGTIGRRFYAGCAQVDTIETIGAGHARELFGAPHAYLQPHSGIDANLVAYWAILARRIESPALERAGARHVNDLSEEDWSRLRHELGNQRMLGMSLDAGGHLTHGFRPNISGKMFDQRSYGTDPDTGLIDYAVVRETAREFRPLILVAGYSAYPRRINFAAMREIADEVGATFMVDMAHFRSARRSWWTWRTSPAWSRARCSPGTSTRSRTRISSPRPRTSRCAGRGAAWCCASRSWPRRWTGAARWCSAARCRM